MRTFKGYRICQLLYTEIELIIGFQPFILSSVMYGIGFYGIEIEMISIKSTSSQRQINVKLTRMS